MDAWDAGQRLAVVVLAAVLTACGVYDLYASLWLGNAGTISAVVLVIARAHPILPLLVGILIGHLFWPQQ